MDQSTINFMIVDSLNATMQFGNTMAVGFNGVGGITFDGRVTRYSFTKREKKNFTTYNITVNVMSSGGNIDFIILAGSDGNADATVRDNFGNQLRYYGRLVPLSQSNIYKGRTTY